MAEILLDLTLSDILTKFVTGKINKPFAMLATNFFNVGLKVIVKYNRLHSESSFAIRAVSHPVFNEIGKHFGAHILIFNHIPFKILFLYIAFSLQNRRKIEINQRSG